MKKIKTLLVDDEAGALSALRSIVLSDFTEAEIVGAARTVDEAYAKLKEHKPDLVFLDIQLYNETAFELLERNFEIEFEVVFVTAYDQYAIEAFEKNALSYLLKPISFEAFSRVRNRILKIFRNNIKAGGIPKIFENKIAVPQKDSIEYLDPGDILYIKADGSYCEIYLVGGSKMIVSRPLSFISERIINGCFFRIHRSYLVNFSHIIKWNKSEGGAVILSNQEYLPISRSGRKILEKSYFAP